MLTFESDSAATALIDTSDGEDSWRLEYGPGMDPMHCLPAVGVRPGRVHEVRASRRSEARTETARPETLEFRTPALPEIGGEFPPISVTVSKPDAMEPGVTLFNPRRRRVGRGPEVARFNAGFGMLAALDCSGEVVWSYRTDSRISDCDKARNGNLLFVTADSRIMEVDWLGNTVSQWYAERRPEGPAGGVGVDALTFHHAIDGMPGGNILVLSTEVREIDGYYTDEYDRNAPRKRQKVMGDVIGEFERDGGRIAWDRRAFDRTDPFRIGCETFSNYWIRRGFPNTLDWSHANNLPHDELDDSVVVDFRY